MSEVKKISPVGNIYGWEESQFGEFVLSQDYDALADEAKALREEVAALRARVVVVPEPLNEGDARRECGEYGAAMQRGYSACLRALARINGMTVSEGLLRRISNLFPADMEDDGSGRAGVVYACARDGC
ncbi:TPA: hypothetical protein ACGWQA_002463 [Pseudomonas aeruginosa]|nr:hypothetical protein [Pseudomonas aeruginosa]HEC1642865.1 hypothetical protein [Pseudomonas aeruginosa]HEC1653034.1 hypothetical protein [Pseudomonas aeruginosa]HEC1659064.1 hypothetical protein [Pseudomonas aeruginosa]